MNKTIGRYQNANAQTTTADTTITYSGISLSNCSLGYDGAGGIIIKTPGIYKLASNFVVQGSAAGSFTVQMFEGDTAIKNSYSTATFADGGDVENITILSVVTVKGTCCTSSNATLYFKAMSAGTVNNATVIIERIA